MPQHLFNHLLKISQIFLFGLLNYRMIPNLAMLCNKIVVYRYSPSSATVLRCWLSNLCFGHICSWPYHQVYVK